MPDKLRVLDLFSGIGGFSLGLERAGMQTVAFCEIEQFPRRVLRKHWPKVPIYEDVRTLTAARLAADGIGVDVICGGFPCQDISVAGKGAGIEGERSGLWKEYARLIGELRPQYVIVENVAALLGRGVSRVLGDLAEIGYDAEWHCIPASHVGAPHRRDRLWIVAYTRHKGICERGQRADAFQNVRHIRGIQPDGLPSGRQQEAEVLAYTSSLGQQGSREPIQWGRKATDGEWQAGNAFSVRFGGQWAAEPNVGRVANGVPNGSHRLKSLGNAVVPQIPELIGRAIIESMKHAA